jgi:hypothetical protein
MSLEVKDDTKLRLSDASTLDLEFSSDDEPSIQSSKLYPELSFHHFHPISREHQEIYTDLQEKLENILETLHRDLEPVCIREERSFSSSSVNLSGIVNSRLCRRRSTLASPSTPL